MKDIHKATYSKLVSVSSRKEYLFGIVCLIGWILVWYIPWQDWATENIWLRLGITLGIFTAPGLWVYNILSSNNNFSNSISFGFVISHFLVAALGTFGRIAQVSFEFVKHSFMLLGLLFLITFLLNNFIQKRRQKPKTSLFPQILNNWPTILIVFITILMSIQRVITSDDMTYLALLNKFQHSSSLDFKDIFLGTENIISPRFWILSTPFNQAFLADLSNLHGIFWIGGFYEPFLTFFSVLSWYSLSRVLGLSKNATAASIAFQIVLLSLLSNYLSPGSPFFTQLSVDKATASFIVYPLFIISGIQLLEQPSFKTFMLCLLVGISLSLMHAVTLAFALTVFGFIGIIRFKNASIKTYLPILLIILIILTPQIFIRFANPETQGSIAYAIDNADSSRGNEKLFTVLGDTNFYGFNPSILTLAIPFQSFFPISIRILEWGWIFLPILSTAFALQHLNHSKLAQFIFSGFLLVSMAGLPLTGWILGYFVSPRMLARTTWLYPYGIATVYFLQSIRDRTPLGKYFKKWTQKYRSKYGTVLSQTPLLLIMAFSTGTLLLVMRFQNLPMFEKLNLNAQRYQEFVHLGQFLDQQINESAIVIGTDSVNDLIPGLAGKAYVVNFRDSKPLYAYFYTEETRKKRLSDQERILLNSSPPEIRLNLIEEYNIEYILIKAGERHIINNLISSYPSRFNLIKIDRYYILEVLHDITP